jgi:hypothetical protein
MQYMQHQRLIVFLAFCAANAMSLFSVNLTSVAYNYAVSVNVGGVNLPLIVDTGNSRLTLLDWNSTTINFDTSDPNVYSDLPVDVGCLTLWEDDSYVVYYNVSSSNNCRSASAAIVIPSDTGGQTSQLMNVTVTVATQFRTPNLRLHDWRDTGGNIGLGYCGQGGCPKIYGDYGDLTVYGEENVMSPFRMLLYNVTGNTSRTGIPQVLGLDFNAEDNAAVNSNFEYTNTSSMQLGGVLETYSSTMKWYQQPTNFPTYHTFMTTSLGVCGVNLLQSVKSYTWPVLVDTGSTCMKLPGEMYDSLSSWLLGPNGDATFASGTDLPSLMFQMDDGLVQATWKNNVDGAAYASQEASDFLYVPLQALLINTSFFDTDSSVMNVTVGSETRSLCILKSYNALGADDTNPMINPPPSIVLGSLALRSLYFAADFDAVKVGFANKISSAAQQSHFSNDASLCKSKATCVGHQGYDYSTNTCVDPDCDDYFFVELDPDSRSCVYRQSMYNAGMVIIILCTLFEVTSFFALQYSSLQIMGITDPDVEGTMSNNRPMNTRVGAFSAFVGEYCAHGYDMLAETVKDAFSPDVPGQHEHED